MSSSPRSGSTLSILGSANLQPRQFETLLPLLRSVEQVAVEQFADSGASSARWNRAADGAASDWILVLDDREVVSAELARDLASAVGHQSPPAWGYRIRTVILYEGQPLHVSSDAGDVRLFHRRHARFEATSVSRSIKVQGTVIRLAGSLVQPTFDSRTEHEGFLSGRGRKRSLPGHVAAFLLELFKRGTGWKGSALRRYLWVESRWKISP